MFDVGEDVDIGGVDEGRALEMSDGKVDGKTTGLDTSARVIVVIFFLSSFVSEYLFFSSTLERAIFYLLWCIVL